jgi:hypothetical protein
MTAALSDFTVNALGFKIVPAAFDWFVEQTSCAVGWFRWANV